MFTVLEKWEGGVSQLYSLYFDFRRRNVRFHDSAYSVFLYFGFGLWTCLSIFIAIAFLLVFVFLYVVINYLVSRKLLLGLD